MIWIIFRTGVSPKAPATRFSEQLAFFNARKGLPDVAKKTVRYAEALVHPTNGDVAFPVLDEDASLIPSSPHQFEQVTPAQLEIEGFFPPSQVGPQLLAQNPRRRIAWRVATALVSASAAGTALWYLLS